MEEQRADKGSAVEFITTEQWYTVSSMADAALKHEEAQKLLHHGVTERVLHSDFDGIPVQSRLDWFTEIGEVPVIVDLKTCSDLDSFEYDARKFMYGIQFAFYQQILVSATIDEYALEAVIPPRVFAIAVEKREPFRCGVFEVPDSVLAHFNAKMFSAIESLKQCQSTGTYPTLYESLRTLIRRSSSIPLTGLRNLPSKKCWKSIAIKQRLPNSITAKVMPCSSRSLKRSLVCSIGCGENRT